MLEEVVHFTPRKRFPLILKKAEKIDEQILALSRTRLSPKQIDPIVFSVFPKAIRLGIGAQKIAYKIMSGKRELALKIVKNTSRMFLYIKPYLISGKSSKQRNHSYLKHYWATKACILQKIAEPVDNKDEKQKHQIRKLRRKHKSKLCDLRLCNLGLVSGRVKILDASVKRECKDAVRT